MVSGSRAGEVCGVVEVSMPLGWHGRGGDATHGTPESAETQLTHAVG